MLTFSLMHFVSVGILLVLEPLSSAPPAASASKIQVFKKDINFWEMEKKYLLEMRRGIMERAGRDPVGLAE